MTQKLKKLGLQEYKIMITRIGDYVDYPSIL